MAQGNRPRLFGLDVNVLLGRARRGEEMILEFFEELIDLDVLVLEFQRAGLPMVAPMYPADLLRALR